MMNLLARMRDEGDFEQVIALNDRSCGLKGFMVLHDTSRGPAAGGIRIYPYETEEAALLGRSREAGVPPEALLEKETLARLGPARGWRRWFV
jgi:hypothetical protein